MPSTKHLDLIRAADTAAREHLDGALDGSGEAMVVRIIQEAEVDGLTAARAGLLALLRAKPAMAETLFFAAAREALR